MLTDGDRCESCAGARRAVRMASQRKDRARMAACCAGCSASRAASRLRAPCRLSASLRPTPRTAQSASRRSGQRAQQALPCCATENAASLVLFTYDETCLPPRVRNLAATVSLRPVEGKEVCSAIHCSSPARLPTFSACARPRRRSPRQKITLEIR